MAPNIPEAMASVSEGSSRDSFHDYEYDEDMPHLEDIEIMDAHIKNIEEENDRVESENQISIRRVSFAPTLAIVVETLPKRNRDVFWLTEAELKLHKQQAMFSCKEFRKSYSNEGLKALQQIWPKIATVCISLDSDEEIAQRLWKELLPWCSKGGLARRGLERWVSKEHATFCEHSVRAARDAVLKFAGSSQQELSMVAEQTTRSARILARLFGLADDAAIRIQTRPSRRFSLIETRHEIYEQSKHSSMPMLDYQRDDENNACDSSMVEDSDGQYDGSYLSILELPSDNPKTSPQLPGRAISFAQVGGASLSILDLESNCSNKISKTETSSTHVQPTQTTWTQQKGDDMQRVGSPTKSKLTIYRRLSMKSGRSSAA
eukprot:CAMPEP_0198282836 /NCGR_PEP_ID=MMETSP1449-20131203/2582_1 /TAXON_ID=420275 /ORGANISM="Attheya septentrionalis, Strain CCMP2084" /LENGTH=375 /DNA_ID=CAMNT_0043979251 /DNA_START=200 /DNA_END=1327 /DNA_ORIENTATION=+